MWNIVPILQRAPAHTCVHIQKCNGIHGVNRKLWERCPAAISSSIAGFVAARRRSHSSIKPHITDIAYKLQYLWKQMLNDDDFRELLQSLDRPWAGYRKVRKGVKKRVRRQMEQLGCRSMEDYLQQLRARPEVRAACEKCLLVTISRFFRDLAYGKRSKRDCFPSSFGISKKSRGQISA